MSDLKFETGRLHWRTATMDAATLRSSYLEEQPWKDGFIAFSASEQRLAVGDVAKLSTWLEGRSDANDGPEGYLMEAGLWRSAGSSFEELAIERDGEAFFVQHWELKTAPDAVDGMECYYRTAKTFTRGNVKPFSGAMESLEIVVPEHRLRFYLTKGV